MGSVQALKPKKGQPLRTGPDCKSLPASGIICHMAGTREVSALDRAAATRIRVLAAERNMKQAEVAEAAGISTSTFNRYWNEKTSMTLGDLDRVLTALGTTWEQEAENIRAVMHSGK